MNGGNSRLSIKMNRKELIRTLKKYKTKYPEEQAFIPRFLSLLNNFRKCYTRDLITGHMTASAFITDRKARYVLLTHHRKLNRWLQPGGHADGMEDIRAVAAREAEEETGLFSLKLAGPDIFDTDIHQIPYYAGIQAHFHYDIRFLFIADEREPLQISDESHDLSWVEMDRLDAITDNNRSILRMAEKMKAFFS